MRHLVLSLALLVSAAASVFGQSVVDTVRIDVLLRDNGDARITEKWSIDVRGSITEWYLVASNLGKMDISGLSVTDETGCEYSNIGEWDIDRSREQKARKCGLVTKSDGYEICWGIGSLGSHLYSVSYDLTGLVQGHSDMDGFNHMFVARNLGSLPAYIELRIRKPGESFSASNAKIWAFGFHGSVEFEGGDIVARTSRSFTSDSGMIVMAGFDKGIFTPSIADSRTFEEIKEKAMKGSDYSEEDGDLMEKLMVALFALMGIGAVAAAISSVVKQNRRRKFLFGGKKKDVPWFREVPVGGDLQKAGEIYGVMEGKASDISANLIPAYMTRLFYKGALFVTNDMKGKAVVGIKPDFTQSENSGLDESLEYELYAFFKEASGEDLVLQEKELNKWLGRNASRMYSWKGKTLTGQSIWSLQKEDVQEVYGLKKFLKDFTLIEDRGVVEVGLWNNYLIFASLFGIADQVKKDFKKICPEYFRMSQVAESLYGDTAASATVYRNIILMSNRMNMSAINYENQLRAREEARRGSGGGGFSSFGGGGGFSGGGSGGGGR